MKLTTRVLASLMAMLLSVGAFGEQRLYLSAGDVITVFKIDAQTGALESMQEVALTGAGPTTLSPNKQYLYAVAKGTGGGQSGSIVTFRVLDDGALSQVYKAGVNLRPGYLATDAGGDYLAGNHYGPGKVTMWKLEGGLYKGKTVQELALDDKCHCTVFSPDNRFLLVPTTGPNKVYQNRFDSVTGQLAPHILPYAKGPQGDDEARQPRHLIFHPNKKTVYTTLEREHAGVGVWRWDAAKGTLRIVQNIITEPAGFKGIITTADLHLTPDQKFLYVSNRDTTTRGATTGEDTIVGFKVDPLDQSLKLIGHTPAPHVPRTFAISPDGQFLFAAGQGDAKLAAYRIDGNSGQLAKIKQYTTGKNPIWVEAVQLP